MGGVGFNYVRKLQDIDLLKAMTPTHWIAHVSINGGVSQPLTRIDLWRDAVALVRVTAGSPHQGQRVLKKEVDFCLFLFYLPTSLSISARLSSFTACVNAYETRRANSSFALAAALSSM